MDVVPRISSFGRRAGQCWAPSTQAAASNACNAGAAAVLRRCTNASFLSGRDSAASVARCWLPIVIALGAAGRDLLAAASAGALAALLVVLLLGLVLHRPVASIPENTLKFVVGLLLTSFGTFWFGEGTRLPWPGGDWSLLALFAGYTAVAVIAVRICRQLGQHGAVRLI